MIEHLTGRALPSLIKPARPLLLLGPQVGTFPRERWHLYSLHWIKSPHHQFNLETTYGFRCACNTDGPPYDNVQNNLKGYVQIYSINHLEKLYTREGKISQKDLSSNTTHSNTCRYSVPSVGAPPPGGRAVKPISQGCSEVREIDNPYKRCLCESVCVLKIVHFVN